MDRLTRATAQIPAVPDDVDTDDVEKVSGVVELPLHIRWSGPPRRYDLADRGTSWFCPDMFAKHGQLGWSTTAEFPCLADAPPGNESQKS
jgi:hypothetical protein